MGHIFSELYLFLISVFAHWQIWLSGGGIGGFIVLIWGVIERFRKKTLSNKTYAYWFLILFFLCSCFLSWVDKDDDLRAQKKATSLQLSANQLVLKAAQDQYRELKAECSYQKGVVDTLVKQNLDQQSSINNCQNQAIERLTPPPLRAVPFLDRQDDPYPDGWADLFFVFLNKDLEPSHIIVSCDHHLIFSVSIATLDIPWSVGTSWTDPNGSQSVRVATPASSPTNPLRVIIVHHEKNVYCNIAM